MTARHAPRLLASLITAATLALLLVSLTPTACQSPVVKSVLNASPVASVVVNPASATLVEGTATVLTAIPRDENGDVLTGRHVTWTSSGPAASVEPTGRVRGENPGTATITATSEGMHGTAEVTVIAAPPQGATHVLVGAGDIADGSAASEATARLLDTIAGTVFTTGDNAYPDGTDADFAQRYQPTWGRHKARTRPCPGNHDYHTSGAAAYFRYFGASAGPPNLGYYSYDIGDWHIIALNSNIGMNAGSPQEAWLRADLATNNKDCILAYWHHPRFSSGDHGSSKAPEPLWQALYEAGAEIIVVGHDHNYQRFAPQTATGQADPARGIRQFVAGTGGAGLYDFPAPIANTETYNVDTHGVLKLTLGPGSYSWEFIPIPGKTYTDSGSGTCHR